MSLVRGLSHRLEWVVGLLTVLVSLPQTVVGHQYHPVNHSVGFKEEQMGP